MRHVLRHALPGVVLAGSLTAAALAQAPDPSGAKPSAVPGAAVAPSPPAGPSAQLAPGVTFEVTELRRLPDRNVVQLRFAVVNRGEAEVTLQEFGLANPNQLTDIHLVDFAGRRQYGIGAAAQCLCTTFRNAEGGRVAPGQRREFWAWYGLPAGNVRTMAVQLAQQAPILDVPLQ